MSFNLRNRSLLNMGNSPMIVGCLMGMDVRICGPKPLKALLVATLKD